MTDFFIRVLQELDPSEEPGVCDVLAVRPDGYRYSPDVYDNYAEAESAAVAFAREGENADHWDATNYPGIDVGTSKPAAATREANP